MARAAAQAGGRGRAVGRLALALMMIFAILSAACGATQSALSATPSPPSANTAVASASTLADLRNRPLNLPAPSTPKACPTTAFHDLNPIVKGGKGKGPGFGFGPGPAYLSGINILYPGGFDNEIWLIDPTYKGQLLVRGRQLTGPQIVSFQEPTTFADSGLSSPGDPPPGPPVTTVTIQGTPYPFYEELDLPAASATDAPGYWRMFFARTHIDAPGCYAFQLDGAAFSLVIVFQVPDAARPGG